MKKGLTEIVFILDKSGSMCGLEDDTIGGYNSFINKQKKEEGDAVISTVLFSTKREVIHNRVSLKDVPPLTDKEYSVEGCTALLDAIGLSISHIVNVHKKLDKNLVPEKTIFVITTDGMENSSVEFSYKNVKDLIEKETNKYGWEFMFLGANIDAVKEGKRFGIKESHAVSYHQDSYGTNLNFRCLSESISGLRRGESINSAWKKDIELYHDKTEGKKKRGKRRSRNNYEEPPLMLTSFSNITKTPLYPRNK